MPHGTVVGRSKIERELVQAITGLEGSPRPFPPPPDTKSYIQEDLVALLSSEQGIKELENGGFAFGVTVRTACGNSDTNMIDLGVNTMKTLEKDIHVPYGYEGFEDPAASYRVIKVPLSILVHPAERPESVILKSCQMLPNDSNGPTITIKTFSDEVYQIIDYDCCYIM